MNKLAVYMTHPIETDEFYERHIKELKAILEETHPNWVIITPLDLKRRYDIINNAKKNGEGKPIDYLLHCLQFIPTVDYVYFPKGWHVSNDCKIQNEVAYYCKKKVIYEEGV